ncbi:MAG: BrxA/BrxB family bacilliredoxin [Bryobacteraceae bacterium]|nr:BrxA/BrxB family bacilliredoxin [Solibacteraceae bacterium]MCO5349484.1 BrxA/BrxB family bacilliredoxin [Bryobacteraceae bacterium]
MAYPEPLLIPMRADITQYGVQETRTPEELDAAIASHGTVLVVTNSVCGCAASKARPAVGLALQHANRPDSAVTVFAGGDVEAVQHLRDKHLAGAGVPPSSPSFALFRDGKPVWAMHRFQIESRQAPDIAADITKAFDEFCTPQSA